MQRKAVLYDKAGDQHYDYISAWIKSTRGSDPDASLYYLAAMLEGGEDPRFIARRMIILASEDVGNADPQALPIAIAAAHAVEHVGLPECQFALAQARDLPRRSRRSRTRRRARSSAPRAHIAEPGAAPPPGALRNAAIPAMRQDGPRGRLRVPARRARATSTTRSTCRTGSRTSASTRPTTPRRRMRERLAALRRARGREP